jgi:hypothetical protein
MEVLVKASISATLTQVNEKVRKRAPWILRQQSFSLSYHPKTRPKKFVGGESHLYLGRHYRLRVLMGINAEKLAGGYRSNQQKQSRRPKSIKGLVSKTSHINSPSPPKTGYSVLANTANNLKASSSAKCLPVGQLHTKKEDNPKPGIN